MSTTVTTRQNLSVIALLGILIVCVTVFLLTKNDKKDPRFYDGKDPKKTGCEKGAETVGDPVPVMLPDGTEFGKLHFRVSKRCGTVWGTIFTTGPKPEGYDRVVIKSIRRKDGKETEFETAAYDSNQLDGRIWGDMLGSNQEIGCITITAQVFQHGKEGPMADTPCRYIS